MDLFLPLEHFRRCLLFDPELPPPLLVVEEEGLLVAMALPGASRKALREAGRRIRRMGVRPGRVRLVRWWWRRCLRVVEERSDGEGATALQVYDAVALTPVEEEVPGLLPAFWEGYREGGEAYAPERPG